MLGKHPIGYHPIVYWLFHSNILGKQPTLEPSKGPKRRQCHYDIKGIQDFQAKQIYEEQQAACLLDIRICLDNGTDRPVCFDTDHDILVSKSKD